MTDIDVKVRVVEGYILVDADNDRLNDTVYSTYREALNGSMGHYQAYVAEYVHYIREYEAKP